ncbi:protein fuzzy homolog isoform X1 [Topomyia yanbarensis]|uniref:protein fuzzy homolog isoform X1 n=2 Tax=Topomyia yanbarensis TaxID=2498891 RepID=UPI00273C3390|nr:protein fuzzy homolog isoform X1 [Topomyia yanbarensis]
MSIHLLCLTSDGGVPIFSKKKGECENLPFSTIASLNGVHMFCKSQNVDLSITHLEEGMIIWKEYDNTLMMIGIAKGIPEKALRNLMDYSYYAMVFCVGISAINKIKNIDRFKRELKNCYALIDQLLEAIESDLYRFIEAVLCSESLAMLVKLNEFSLQIGSPFCSILVRQKIACGTEGWWDLDIVDRKLLTVLLNASSTIQQDVPVFLPKKSPGIAYRFISIPITQGVSICALCGAEPPYDKLQTMSQQFWMNEIDLLITAEQNYPKNYPATIELDSSILGFLLLNKEHSKFVISRNVHLTSAGKRTLSGNHRLDILRTFYHQSVEAMDDLFREGEKIVNLEQYWCSDYHKCHALLEGPNILCVLYTSAIPTPIMRLVTQKTLNTLISDKDVCW